MLKDIEYPQFDGVGMALVRELNPEGQKEWNVYVVNYNNALLEGVLVSSKGYGTIDGEERKSSTLRHFIDTLEPLSFAKVEPMPEDLFVLNNEYWLSFYHEGKMYERKFVFTAHSITPAKLEHLNLIDKKGILLM
jgi:hypothetical protein